MLWLIGGTSESAAIARALDQANIPYCVTVTTAAGRSLYDGCHGDVSVGCLPGSAMGGFIQTRSIRAIVDASHPFATAVSEGAIAAAQAGAIAYLRFERPDLMPEPEVTLLQPLLESGRLRHQRVLLILGYRLLHHFRPWQAQATLFARILPSQLALDSALVAGFDPRRLIALRPPIMPELETALWRQWQISTVVTKASGAAGGEDVKRAIAQALSVELIVLSRPRVRYPQQTDQVGEAIAFARESVRV
ncbi:MAG: cobalt-precorrin-6A reductase [Synechococcales cyanobacterium CRU_2_2]|nr:cobalt-precorrin-6A reductase [Synechococcales cyanobacterium CRU_2_2]